MGRDKLIDLLFSNNERLMLELAGLRAEIEMLRYETRKANDVSTRWEECAMAAEKRAEAAESDRSAMQDRIDRLLSLVGQLRNGKQLKAMTDHAEKAEKTAADLIASGRVL